MATRKLQVEIIGDASSLNKALGQAQNSTTGLGKAFKTLGKVALVGLGAAFAGLAVSAKVGFDELAEGQKVAAQTNAALKSTGGIANVTAKEIDALAQSTSRKTGIDDEAVQASENMLLTFTKVRNEVGKNNDIFNQATEVVADMATRMNNGAVPTMEQMSTTSIRIGKALNDPIKGVGALSRVGVQFTEDQKAMIKEMVKSGDVMGAQKLILKELQTEFGGSAKAAGETFPGQLAKLKNAFEGAAEGLAVALLPFLLRFTEFVNTHMPEIQAGFELAGSVIAAAFNIIGPAIERVIAIGQGLVSVWQENRAVIEPIAAALGVLAAALLLYQGYVVTVTAVTKAWAAVQAFLNAVMAANPLLLVVVAIAALAAALIVAYRRSDEFRAIVNAAFDAVKGAAQALANFFTNTLVPAFQRAWAFASEAVSRAWQVIGPIIRNIEQLVRGMVNIVAGIFTGDWSRAWQGMKTAAQAAVDLLLAWVTTIPSLILKALGALGSILYDAGIQIIQGLWNGLKAKWEDVKNWLGGLKDLIPDLKGPPAEDLALLNENGRLIMEGLQNGMGAGWGPIEKWLGTLPEKMRDNVAKMIDAAAAAVREKQSVLEAAFSELGSAAMSAFDKVTSQHVTPTERKVNLEDERRAAQERAQALRDAQNAVWAAVASGDQEAYRQALQQQKDAEFAIQRAADEKKAAQERKKYEESRELQRVHFEEQLARLNQQLLNQEITAQQYNQRLIALFKRYEVPFNKAANKLGTALAEGLRDAMDDVGKAAEDLAWAIRNRLSNIKVVVQIDVRGSGEADKRQHGGPVRRGSPYVVGEVGPELFIPSQNGRIISNSAAARGSALVGAGMNVVLNFNGPTVGTSREFEDTIRRALYDVSRRNPGIGLATG